MKGNFPIEFTLENGTQVVVNHAGDHTYQFSLKPEKGNENQFSYNDKETFTTEKEQALDFDQLNALRRFWLEQEKEELS
jgi:outer membrane lipoprotein-sorting protein